LPAWLLSSLLLSLAFLAISLRLVLRGLPRGRTRFHGWLLLGDYDPLQGVYPYSRYSAAVGGG
jgi:hypothetical protein